MYIKRAALFIFLLCNMPLFSQVVKGRVADSLTQEPVPCANITLLNKNLGASADANGDFEFDLQQSKDILVFSCVGYSSKKIAIASISPQKKYTIYLSQKLNQLDEIVINKTKVKYTSVKKIRLPKKAKVSTGLPFGNEICGYIKNPDYRNGLVKTVILDLQKNKKADYIATYNIRFYEYDKLLNRPGKELYTKNVIVHPENRTYVLKIPVDTLAIPFPSKGICVGVEIINIKYSGKLKAMAQVGPYINYTHTPLEILSWSRYRNKDWNKDTHKSQVRKDFVNFLIGIEAVTEK